MENIYEYENRCINKELKCMQLNLGQTNLTCQDVIWRLFRPQFHYLQIAMQLLGLLCSRSNLQGFQYNQINLHVLLPFVHPP